MKAFRIISGGQTGADRAALDWAIAYGIPHGGSCPAGRRAEDGFIDPRYLLTPTRSPNYRVRTARNVRDSDATLILNLGELDGGSLETLRVAQRAKRPVVVMALDSPPAATAVDELRSWLRRNGVATLNVAGPRESKRPGIYAATMALLDRLLPAVLSAGREHALPPAGRERLPR